MGKLQELISLGQSVWIDYIRRSSTRGGELAALVDAGVRGVTSNPAIFEKAIAGSDDYDEEIVALAAEGMAPAAVFERLAIDDIREAADVLQPVYEHSDGADGFVSLEVPPTLADETESTQAQGLELFRAVERKNVMIKIPGTVAGVAATEASVAAGININVTLLFSIEQYERVAEAYIAGLEQFAASGGDPGTVASVASFFVSRVDTAVDALLPERSPLRGRIAIDNARLAYQRCRELFSGDRWAALASSGARIQRPLWASTGTKNEAYPDTLYVDELIGADTVNTVPPATLDAYLDHGTVSARVADDVAGAAARFRELRDLGIDFRQIAEQLQRDGVGLFVDAFESLLASLTEKSAALVR